MIFLGCVLIQGSLRAEKFSLVVLKIGRSREPVAAPPRGSRRLYRCGPPVKLFYWLLAAGCCFCGLTSRTLLTLPASSSTVSGLEGSSSQSPSTTNLYW